MSKLPAPYRYRTGRRGFPKPTRLDRPLSEPKPDEGLTGELQGLPASDTEERFARALDKQALGYEFRAAQIAGRNLPGEVEVDFMVYDGATIQPVQIDGEFAHKSAEQKSEDAIKDVILDKSLEGTGALPVKRIPGAFLETQEEVNNVVKEMFWK